uniref:PilZ domain-containing protein n=1 Tax=Cellvibrio fontiphilus TaxID=1815559 RepID=UPI002B4BA6EA|nr:PilZ domain-containing protein [Cellvibrio fontiphilus]
MSHNCSKEHDRDLERHIIQGDVDVYDSLRDQYLGRLVNIHTQGLMVMGDVALEEDRLYTLDLHLPEPINDQMVIQLGVDCLWAREADLAGKYWMGFSIIDASNESLQSIRDLVERLGEAY